MIITANLPMFEHTTLNKCSVLVIETNMQCNKTKRRMYHYEVKNFETGKSKRGYSGQHFMDVVSYAKRIARKM